MNTLLKNAGIFIFLLNLIPASSQTITPEDGNWAERYVTLTNTSQAELMVRVGDIDNLNFGWPANFNPFSGKNTPRHSFPWTPNEEDPDGTDRIMVVTSYTGTPPAGIDGYTNGTSRPANSVRPIVLNYDLNGLTVQNVVMQIFVDDFQASQWKAKYTVKIDNVRVPFLETIINSLLQTGPIGKLISVNIPQEFVYLFEDGEVSIVFDDLTTGAGDGYAIDFVKLLINMRDLGQYATISGNVVKFGTATLLDKVKVTAAGFKHTFTDESGAYTLDSIPPGIITVQTYKAGYGSISKNIQLTNEATGYLDFFLVSPAPVLTEISPDTSLIITDLASSFTLKFDTLMDVQTFNTNNIILSDRNSNLTGNLTKTNWGFTFTPDSLLKENQTYILTLKSDIKSQSGVNLEKDFLWLYKTTDTTGKLVLTENDKISVYPVPARSIGTLFFKNSDNADCKIQIFNAKGSVVYEAKIKSMQIHSLNLSEYIIIAGIYFVNINSEGKHSTRKIQIIK